ncbi:MAG TPA: molybdopterin-binding protein [Paenalcaligenes sp.]|nr:molybdopterin-binding protein [Paenalcaligenes sp.]
MVEHNAQPKFRLIIIGDEILSGRRQDKHFSKCVEILAERGLQLHAAEIISDERAHIAATLRRSFATDDVVFCCGGIGATPDDQTRQAAAEALGVPLQLHPQARELITELCRDNERKGRGSSDMSLPENQQRLKMGCFPQGAEIIPNSFNKIPGFFINNHTFTPGFPVMAWPMIEWVLDKKYAQWHHQEHLVEHSFLVFGLPESRITPALEEIEKRWQGVKAFSLPSVGENGGRPHLELGVRGAPQSSTEALRFLRLEVERLGGQLTPSILD